MKSVRNPCRTQGTQLENQSRSLLSLFYKWEDKAGMPLGDGRGDEKSRGDPLLLVTKCIKHL